MSFLKPKDKSSSGKSVRNFNIPSDTGSLQIVIANKINLSYEVNTIINCAGASSLKRILLTNNLEKTFVIKKISGFSKNLRKEVTSKCKYYFYDTGIRNAVISQFNCLEDRNDKGQLFENFIIMERMKKNAFNGFYGSSYFWRTYDGQEIDLIEEIDNILSAYEIKFNEKKKIKIPKDWSKNYKYSTFSVINSKNYLDYILLKD